MLILSQLNSCDVLILCSVIDLIGVSINCIKCNFMFSDSRLKAPASWAYIRCITISTFDFMHHIGARGVEKCIFIHFNKFV